jgi:hypothetical protein
LVLLWCCSWRALAASQPADGAVLSHTQVMFSWDEQPGADRYELSIRGGNGPELLFRSTSLAFLVKEGLRFGQGYRWQYSAYQKAKLLYQSPSYGFSVAASPLVDNARFRYAIRKRQVSPGPFQDNLLLIDHLGVAVDRRGLPVWYLPFDSADMGLVPKYRNLQMTRDGSFTFLRGENCAEKDRLGQILWTGPNDGAVSGQRKEFYHHDFEKRPNGHFLVCGYQFVEMPHLRNPLVTTRVRYNTLIEYDATGRVVWSWNEKDHSSLPEIFEGAADDATEVPGTHLNGFACNEQTGVCVLSTRNNSTLTVIQKATGKVLSRWQGERPRPGGPSFAAQHTPVFLPNGDLLLYNNNIASRSADTGGKAARFPTILQLRFSNNYQQLQTVWEYECRLPEHPDGWAGKEGSAQQLPNGNILVCVGGGNQLLEVTRDKKTVWKMEMEAFDTDKKEWLPFSNYRSHFISTLYPWFFTVQRISGTAPVKVGGTIAIKVNNDGSEADEYQVELFSAQLLQPYRQRFRLQPGQSRMLKIPLRPKKAAPRPGDTRFVVVRVSPSGNPAGARDWEYRVE